MLLMTVLLVLAGLVLLLIGYARDSLTLIYLSIGCAAAAGVALIIFSRMSRGRAVRAIGEGGGLQLRPDTPSLPERPVEAGQLSRGQGTEAAPRPRSDAAPGPPGGADTTGPDVPRGGEAPPGVSAEAPPGDPAGAPSAEPAPGQPPVGPDA
jgi:hypothetical protein